MLNPPIAHLDLKSPNVMMLSLDPGSPLCSKIADFGTSRLCNFPITGRFVQNPVWLAPEIFTNSEYTYTADTYAFGVMLWEMITRKAYLGDFAFMSEIEDRIMNGYRPEVPCEKQGCPIPYAEVIQHCWVFFPSFLIINGLLEKRPYRSPKFHLGRY